MLTGWTPCTIPLDPASLSNTWDSLTKLLPLWKRKELETIDSATTNSSSDDSTSMQSAMLSASQTQSIIQSAIQSAKSAPSNQSEKVKVKEEEEEEEEKEKGKEKEKEKEKTPAGPSPENFIVIGSFSSGCPGASSRILTAAAFEEIVRMCFCVV